MPPVMITCVTPTAMMPMTETCRMMIVRRCGFIRKLWPRRSSRAPRRPARCRSAPEDADLGRQAAASAPGVRAWRVPCAADVAYAMVVVLPAGWRCRAAQRAASSMTFTWVASARSRKPVTRPSCMTMMRSLMPSTSGISDEIMMTATPSRGELGDQAVDLRLGADVDAAGRLVEDQDAAAWSAASGRSAPSAGCRRRGSRSPPPGSAS